MSSALIFAIATIVDSSHGATPSDARAIPSYVSAAVANPIRPPKDVRRDPSQKPEQVLAFAGVKPGHLVADIWPAPPYSTGLLSLVVGSRGHVYAIVPPKLLPDVPEAEADLKRDLAPYTNVTLVAQPFDAIKVPRQVDVVWMGKIYHDFPNEVEMGRVDIAAVNKGVFDALKPGGIYIVKAIEFGQVVHEWYRQIEIHVRNYSEAKREPLPAFERAAGVANEYGHQTAA